MGEDRSRRQDLDVIGAAMRQLADLLPHFPRAVRYAKPVIQWKLNVRWQAGHCARAFTDCHVRARNIHTRACDDPICNRIAHGDVVESAIDTDIAHRGKASHQCEARIGNRGVRGFHGRLPQQAQRLGIRQIGQMGVAVDEARKHRLPREVNEARTLRSLQIWTNSLDASVTDQDHLVG
jgi:hypothetical protein